MPASGLKTGKLIRKEMAKHDISSPVLVGRQDSGLRNQWKLSYNSSKPIPEKFGEISKTKIGALKCTSPSPVGSKLLIRKSDRIACYELSVWINPPNHSWVTGLA